MSVKLTTGAAQKTSEVVRFVKGQPTRGPHPRRDLNTADGSFPFRLLAKEEFANYLRCRTWNGTVEGSDDILVAKPVEWRGKIGFYEPDASAGVGSEIFAVNVPGTGIVVSDNEIILLDLHIRAGAFAVDLTQTGGSNGNATTAASWTYTVERDGVTLATTVTPQDKRPTVGRIVAATKGIAQWDGTNILLLSTNEGLDSVACPESA